MEGALHFRQLNMLHLSGCTRHTETNTNERAPPCSQPGPLLRASTALEAQPEGSSGERAQRNPASEAKPHWLRKQSERSITPLAQQGG